MTDKNVDIVKTVLKIIGTSGVLAVTLVAPNVLMAVSTTQKRKKKYQQRYYINRVVRQMIENGLIKDIKNEEGLNCLRLTESGKTKLKEYALQDLKIKKPWRWDKKYRVIIFDIKEFRRGVRDNLRKWLESLGFVRLQNSVWVYPYDCREIIILLKSYYHIGKEVIYMTVDSIENDGWLKKKFDLN